MNLKSLRISNNLRQEDVAKIINKSAVAYGYYETGAREPDIKTLITLANYFDVSLDYLCGRIWNNNIGYIPEEKKEVVKIILQLNEINTIKTLGFASGLLAGQN